MQITLENTDFMKRAISELQKGVDDKTLFEVGEITAKAMGTYAPEDTGALKNDYKLEMNKNIVSVIWGYKGAPTEAYAHYQYEGVVFSPNIPDFRKHKMWTDEFVSPPGKGTKHPTGRKMGQRKTIVLKDGRVIFIHGYTTPGSSDHWIVKARKTPEVYYPMRTKVMQKLKLAIGEKIPGRKLI